MRKLSLSNLQKQEFENNQLSKIKGGGLPGNCGCGCNGPSSTCANGNANWRTGATTPGVARYTCRALNNEFEAWAHIQGMQC